MSALLLVGHGTKDAAGVEQFHQLVEVVRGLVDVPVAGGFLELSAPPIQDAVNRLVEAGHQQVDVVPLVLVAAGHSKGDVPAALERERRRHPGLAFRYGRPLGPHPLLLQDLGDRVGEAGEDTAVLLVGRGATDPDANAEVAKTSRLLWEGRGLGTVETAFVSLARPSVPEGLERCRQLGYRRTVVLPYFLFEGVLPERIRAQAAAWAAAHPEQQVTTAAVIGPSAHLAQLVAERLTEISAGDLRMNCDTCMYRTLMPGYEDRLGAPQTPHDHPDDPTHAHAHSHGDHHH